MSASAVHRCTCRAPEPHPDRVLHQQINLLVSLLDEQQLSFFVAFEAGRLGYCGAQRLEEISGMSRHTIRRGRRELDAGLADRSPERVRAPAVGGRRVRRRTPSSDQRSRRCSHPRQPATRWGDGRKPSAARFSS